MLQIQNQNKNYNKPKVRKYNKAYNLEAEFWAIWWYMKQIGKQDQLKKVQLELHETDQQMKDDLQLDSNISLGLFLRPAVVYCSPSLLWFSHSRSEH